MKSLLIILAVLLFAGAWLGEAIIQDSGYVLIAYQNTSIETSLWVMAALVIIGFGLLHWLVNLVTHFKSPAARLRQWRQGRNERKAGAKAIEGLKSGSSGDWWRSRRLLSQAADLSSAPTIYYIEAARMAAKDGDEKECRRLLDMASQSDAGVEQLVQHVGAELDFELGHAERARVSLEQMIKQAPNNTQNKALLCQVLEQLQDWAAIAPLIPELRKANALSEEQARRLRRKYATSILEARADDLDALNKAWESLSFDAQQELSVKRAYIKQLTVLGAQNRAETLLKGWLNKAWDEQLLLTYSELSTGDPKEQLQTAKRWLQTHPESAALELSMARLSRRNELWGAAIQHYRKSLSLEASKTTQLELADLYLQLDEASEALKVLSSANDALKLPAPTEADRQTRLELLNH